MTLPMALGVGLVVALAAGLGMLIFVRAARRRIVVRVYGDSMVPSLRDGDLLVARRYAGDPVEVGDIVVFAQPPLPPGFWAAENPDVKLPQWWIKRVAARPGDPVPPVAIAAAGQEVVPPGALVVLGDSPGLDSRAFGLLPIHLVLGVVHRPAMDAKPG